VVGSDSCCVRCLQAQNGLPALAGGEQEEHHGRPAGPGGDGGHQGGHGALQGAGGGGAPGEQPSNREPGSVASFLGSPKNIQILGASRQ